MYISDFYIAIVIGLALSLLVTEVFGIVPGGIIVPGYMALICDTPALPLLVLLISFITFGIVKYILPRFMMLYGRKRFVAIMILSVLLALAFEFAYPRIPFATFELRGIGVVMPALIANCYFKQGVKHTLFALIPTTAAVFGIISLIFIIT